MEKITTVGIDLAKSVFSLHGVDGARRVMLRKAVRRDRLVETVAGLSPCDLHPISWTLYLEGKGVRKDHQ